MQGQKVRVNSRVQQVVTSNLVSDGRKKNTEISGKDHCVINVTDQVKHKTEKLSNYCEPSSEVTGDKGRNMGAH